MENAQKIASAIFKMIRRQPTPMVVVVNDREFNIDAAIAVVIAQEEDSAIVVTGEYFENMQNVLLPKIKELHGDDDLTMLYVAEDIDLSPFEDAPIVSYEGDEVVLVSDTHHQIGGRELVAVMIDFESEEKAKEFADFMNGEDNVSVN